VKVYIGHLGLQAEGAYECLLSGIRVEKQFVPVEDQVALIPLGEDGLFLLFVDLALLV
jgi:hypothetical protein